MEHRIADIQYCERLFNAFYDVGRIDSGGVTRLGYSETEDRMHEIFAEFGAERNLICNHDQVGNTFVANSEDSEYYLIGSHLDSVVDGGRYDGVAGVIAGLMVMKWAVEDGLKLPIRVGAFRCEESSNFGCCTIGSGLITNELQKEDVAGRISRNGVVLEEIFKEKGYSFQPERISGIKQYLELHIEQGKVLEETQTEVGIVTKIAGPRRFKLYLRGMAEHSGATPMAMRYDAMCAAAEIILKIERLGNTEAVYETVATVGVVNNHPNVMNVIPGEVQLGVDIRGINTESLERMECGMKEAVKKICERRGIECMDEKIGDISPVSMSEKIETGLEAAAGTLGIRNRRMPSGAGHDAMAFAKICDTGMVFIPCLSGISHNHEEFTTIKSICDGARVLYEYLKGEAV